MEQLEKEIQSLESIKNWNEKITKTRALREKISKQKKKLEELVNLVVKNEIPIKKPKKFPSLDSMIHDFESSSLIEDKIKYYTWINLYISDMEKELFTE
jgi:hypothetical protein